MKYIDIENEFKGIPLVAGSTLYYNPMLRPLIRELWDIDPSGWLNMVSEDHRTYTMTWVCGELHFQMCPQQIFVWKGEKHFSFISDLEAWAPEGYKLYLDFVELNTAVIDTIKTLFNYLLGLLSRLDFPLGFPAALTRPRALNVFLGPWIILGFLAWLGRVPDTNLATAQECLHVILYLKDSHEQCPSVST